MGEEEKKPAGEKKMEEKKPEEGKKPEGEKKASKGEEKKESKEEEKKPEKPAEEKKEEKKTEEGKQESTPPPPQEIVLKVYMHCEGCARKVRRCLKGFEGVEDVVTDCKTHKVVVKGEKADPLKVLDRVQKKSHRQVELLSPIPKPPAPEEKKPEEEKPKPEEKKPEPPPVIMVVLMVHMHCEACAQEIKKRILRMKGVESAEPDLKSSEVTVTGVFDPPKLVEYVYKRTGKHAVIVKQEPEKKEEDKGNKEAKEEKKGGEGGDKEKKAGGEEENKEKKEGGDNSEAKPEATEETKVMDLKRNEYFVYPPRYVMDLYAHPPPQGYPSYEYPPQGYPPQGYPPQIFSDENPNACSVM